MAKFDIGLGHKSHCSRQATDRPTPIFAKLYCIFTKLLSPLERFIEGTDASFCVDLNIGFDTLDASRMQGCL
jgi:hypothetical protein